MITLDEAIEILSRPKTMKGTPQDILEAHDMAITALRQPKIIRCQDCKWSDWYDAADGHRYCHCMETGASGRTADDFCSYAECEEVSE